MRDIHPGAHAASVGAHRRQQATHVASRDGEGCGREKSDITDAVNKNEMYDFLIDFIPREDSRTEANGENGRSMGLNQMVYYYVGGWVR